MDDTEAIWHAESVRKSWAAGARAGWRAGWFYGFGCGMLAAAAGTFLLLAFFGGWL